MIINKNKTMKKIKNILLLLGVILKLSLIVSSFDDLSNYQIKIQRIRTFLFFTDTIDKLFYVMKLGMTSNEVGQSTLGVEPFDFYQNLKKFF